MYTKVGRLPENGEVKCDLNIVTYITSSLVKALWVYTFRGSVPGLGLGFDRLCSVFLQSVSLFLVFPFLSPWSIEDGFVFYPLRDLVTARSTHGGSETPKSNRILDCLLTVACCGETLTPVKLACHCESLRDLDEVNLEHQGPKGCATIRQHRRPTNRPVAL